MIRQETVYTFITLEFMHTGAGVCLLDEYFGCGWYALKSAQDVRIPFVDKNVTFKCYIKLGVTCNF